MPGPSPNCWVKAPVLFSTSARGWSTGTPLRSGCPRVVLGPRGVAASPGRPPGVRLPAFGLGGPGRGPSRPGRGRGPGSGPPGHGRCGHGPLVRPPCGRGRVRRAPAPGRGPAARERAPGRPGALAGRRPRGARPLTVGGQEDRRLRLRRGRAGRTVPDDVSPAPGSPDEIATLLNSFPIKQPIQGGNYCLTGNAILPVVHLSVMIANGLSTTMTRTLAATRIDRLPGLTDDEPFAMSTRPGLVPTGHLCVASTVQLLLRTWTGHLPGRAGPLPRPSNAW